MVSDAKKQKVCIVDSPENYFSEMVQEALEKCKIEARPEVLQYLVSLLSQHVALPESSIKGTLAENLLSANLAEKHVKIDLLKRLGDTSLYVSGFFGDSLKRKIIDIDYYVDIGGIAYAQLAAEVQQEASAEVYSDISRRFLHYVDMLSYISQNSLTQTNQDLLRLYERYILTGSELAKEQLIEKGLFTSPDLNKTNRQ